MLRLARAIEARPGEHGYDGERVARAALAGAGALAVLAELPANPHPGVALAGQAARVSGICALLGAVAPVRETVPLDRPRTLVAVAVAGCVALVGWQQLERRSRPRRPRLAEYPAERRLATTAGVAAGFEGSRFTGTAVAADEIGPGAQDPIRVFVGLQRGGERRAARPHRGRRARAAGSVLPPPDPRLLADAARLRQPDPDRGRGAPLARRRRLGRRPVPRQAHAADARQGADRGADAPRAARGAAPATAGRGPGGLRVRREPRRLGEPERVPRRRRQSARRGGREPRAVDRHAVFLAPAAIAREGPGRRPTRASARSAPSSCWRARASRAGASSSSSAVPTRSCSSAAST